MDINKHIRNFLFVLIVIYYAQGAIYKEGSFLSQGVLLLTIAISFIYFIKTLLNKRKKKNLSQTKSMKNLLSKTRLNLIPMPAEKSAGCATTSQKVSSTSHVITSFASSAWPNWCLGHSRKEKKSTFLRSSVASASKQLC